MKIGFVFDDSLDRDDGVQQYVKTMGRWLIKKGHEVKFLVGDTHAADDLQSRVYSLSKNFGVKANRNRLSIPLPASNKQIKKILEEERFDVLHVQAPYNPLLASKVIMRAGSATGIVATFHIVGGSWVENSGIRLLSLLQRKSLNRIDEHLGVSPAAVEASKKYFRVLPHVSSNVVNLTKFWPSNEYRTSSLKTILFLGRLVERKGVQHLVEAFKLLNDSAVKLIIAGDGPLRESLQTKVAEANLSENVNFLGYINEKDKPKLLREADLAVFPSTSGESFGIVLIESMASGTLTLGGNNEGYSSVLNGPEDMLIDPTDYSAFASRLKMMIYDEVKRKELIDWQRDRVNVFDVERVGPKLLDHYRAAQRHRISLSKHS